MNKKIGLSVILFLLSGILWNCSASQSNSSEGSYINYQETFNRFKNLMGTKPKKGLEFIDSVYRLLSLEKNPKTRGHIYEYKAKAHYIAKQEIDSTIIYAIKANEEYVKAQEWGGQASVLTLIAKMYQVNNNLDQTIFYYKKAEKAAIASGQFIRIPTLYQNLGSVYSSMNLIDSSNLFFLKAKANYKLYNDTASKKRNLASLFIGIGVNYNKKQDYNEAINSYQLALIQLNMLTKKNKSNLIDAHRGLAYSYFYLENADSTLKHSKMVYGMIDSSSTGYLQEQANTLMGDAYFLKKDYQKAHEFLSKAFDLKDLRYKKIIANNAQEINSKYDNIELEKQLALKQQKEKLLSKQNNILLFALACVLALLLLLALAYHSNKKRSRQIDATKKALEKTSEERGVLLKEIHHRVKNNLQSISSMLNLQQRRLQDKDSKKALLESRNRVKAMALIHQNFYENDYLGQITLKPFIENLSNELASLYPLPSPTKIDITSISLELDAIIPLGMILNELLTNAYKYAKRKDNNVQISISGTEQDSSIHLIIKDNGEHFDLSNIKNGLGSTLVESFAAQIKAQVNYKKDNGCKVDIIIPKMV